MKATIASKGRMRTTAAENRRQSARFAEHTPEVSFSDNTVSYDAPHERDDPEASLEVDISPRTRNHSDGEPSITGTIGPYSRVTSGSSHYENVSIGDSRIGSRRFPWSLPTGLAAYSPQDQDRSSERGVSPAPPLSGRSSIKRNHDQKRPFLRERMSTTSLYTRDLTTTPCFGIIHRIRRDIKKCIETALTWEQLHSPKLVFSVIRPLQEAYWKINSPCTIYALLLNRVYFKSQQYTLSSLSVNDTRAMCCELLAIKLLRQLYEEDQSNDGVFRLAILLASVFSPFQGAPKWAIPEGVEDDGGKSCDPDATRRVSTSALELAIVSEAKRFIRAVPTQRVITDIWQGRIVYSATSVRYLIKDQYKKRPIMKYDWKNAPWLDHYRLRVPRIRAALEWLHFSILFISYLTVIRTMKEHTMNGYEVFWVIYGFGFALDKFASLLELGWTVFASNLWNGMDFVFIVMFAVYLPLRLIGLRIDHETAAVEALSILTCAACVLFPRFAFATLSDNLLVLSLRSMLAQFGRLMMLAIWCFAGFFVAFVTLGGGKYKSIEIVQWMIWIWFGLDSTGLQKSNHLHNFLGPVLMVIYACLANTLLLTVLVSILSNTFNAINEDALAEQMYRRAVSTFQDVKSDGIFSFQPPINVLALTLLRPLRSFINAHYYHKIIVLFARVSNFPLLVTIHIVERYWLFAEPSSRLNWLRPIKESFGFFSGSRTNLDAVFEHEDDIDDDSLPGGAFSILEGIATPDTSRARSPAPSATGSTHHQQERDRRRAMSMSESAFDKKRARPTILSKLYAPGPVENWRSLQEEQQVLKDRLAAIEDGQRRIEEALKGLGGGGD